jgi:predicted membrane-bound dolichyl-phosphate-mannose-protein mannosyltransferase
VSDFKVDKWVMSDIHVVVDMVRMWLLVRIYKNAYRHSDLAGNRTMFVFSLLLFQAKYKFIGIGHQFNDCFMILFCLLAILAYQNHSLWLSSSLMALAINTKMSALLMLPGFLLAVDFKFGIVRTVMGLVWIVAC